LEDGNGEIWMCLYFPKPFVSSLAELAVFKFVPHPYYQQSWKTAIIWSQVAFCWSIFGSDI